MEVSQKTKNIKTMTQQSTSWEKKKKTLIKKDTRNPNVHSSIIYNCQDMETGDFYGH